MDRPVVVVAGLGPAGPEYLTAAVQAEIDRVPVRFVRTLRHPAASVVPDPIPMDHFYETAETFDDVYTAIVETLVDAAAEHGEILYAVPGSPSSSNARCGCWRRRPCRDSRPPVALVPRSRLRPARHRPDRGPNSPDRRS
ncbi:MAG: SAM-dependent methyltransferase [Ilumatobacteraceae bacterium]